MANSTSPPLERSEVVVSAIARSAVRFRYRLDHFDQNWSDPTDARRGLVIGFLTPLAGVLVALWILGATFSVLPPPPSASLFAKLSALLMVIAAIGVSLLGPGAFSLDSYLFGRREIVIPPGPRDL